jgi:hypothetical protein
MNHRLPAKALAVDTAAGVLTRFRWRVRTTQSIMSRTIYVGNLPAGIREREVEDVFYKVRLEAACRLRAG